MRKKLLIAGIILVLLIAAVSIIWQAYDLSSDYNYATAKLDIKNGNVKVIHVGSHQASAKDIGIETIAARYGFKNIYVEKYTARQTENGIKNYNELTDTYLSFRNGPGWKDRYKREIDSLPGHPGF